MHVFKMREDALPILRRKALIQSIAIYFVFLVFFLVILTGNTFIMFDKATLTPVAVILLAGIIYRHFSSRARIKKMAESYTLTVSNNLITREMAGLPKVELYYNEVKEIVKYQKGSYTITGRKPGEIISIPYWVSDPVLLESVLGQVSPIIHRGKLPLASRYPVIIVSGILLPLVGVYIFDNKIVVGLLCLAELTTMVWGYIYLRKQAHLGPYRQVFVWLAVIILVNFLRVAIEKLFLL